MNGKKIFKGERPRHRLGSTFDNMSKFLHIGKISRVDYEMGVVDVEFETFGTLQSEVSISSGFMTRRAFVGGMPETGTYVICGFRYAGENIAKVEIVGYLPDSFEDSMKYKLDRGDERYKKAKTSVNDINTVDEKVEYGAQRHKFNKLYPGDVGMWSSKGSDIILDEDVRITNRGMCEVTLRDIDSAYIQNSVQRYITSDGQRIYSGMVTRTIYQSYNEDGSEVPDPVEPADTALKFMSNIGKQFWVLTQRGDKTIDSRFLNDDEHCEPLIEVREEIEELGDSMIGITEESNDLDLERERSNRNFDTTNTKQNHFPLIIRNSGTLVGYNENDSTRYGKVLKSKLFSNHFDTFPTQTLEPVVTGQEPDHTEVRYRSIAYSFEMMREYQHTRHYIDKDGHVDMFIGATGYEGDCPFSPAVEHPLGAGRAADITLGGSLKLLIDKNRNEEESLILDTIGQVRFHLGKDDSVLSSVRRDGKFMATDGTESDYNLGVTNVALSSGNNSDFTNKTAAEHKSLIGTMDGGLTLRVGTDNGNIKRKFFKNGFSDGQGRTKVTSGPDVRDENRVMYGESDTIYQFHDMANVCSGMTSPAATVGSPVADSDIAGHSADVHMCGNMWLRIGKDSANSKSFILDLDGSAVMAFGKDTNSKSLSVEMDGSAEILIQADSSGNALNLHISGNVNEYINGNVTRKITGNLNETIQGTITRTITGAVDETFSSNLTQKVSGNLKFDTMGSTDLLSSGTTKVTGSKIDLN